MADRAAETGAAAPPRDCASSECPAEAVGTERRGTEREEDGEEEKPGAGGPDGSEPKRRESGARAESAEKGHESGDGACGSTAEKRGEPRDGAPVGGGEPQELRILLLGRSGGGRSATGNTLLCREEFKSQLASQPVTTTCKEGRRDWGEWCVVVMDTPAIFGGSQWDKKQLEEERRHCVHFGTHKYCVLLLVTQLGRYTREDREVQKRVKQVFGKGAKKRMVVVFTRREDLGDSSLDEFVKTAENGALRKLVKVCKKQYCAVSNRAPRQDRDAQAEEVLRMAEAIARRECMRGEPWYKQCWQ
ncbi:GTPase IMAP family member 1 isoform X3 [Gallus gallus]|uniref:GTPase IMAP family member 1 isoform X3 n=1 Tax=Gallus gallus TaxID=9031 RepID=UPI001AE771C9|nr:GTPase IMAP family member 1 isoform X3 [Gallus gallus]